MFWLRLCRVVGQDFNGELLNVAEAAGSTQDYVKNSFDKGFISFVAPKLTCSASPLIPFAPGAKTRPACCQMLADNPALGRVSDDIRPGLRRMEHGRHVVFLPRGGGRHSVSRIVHQRMLPDRQSIDDGS
jgi:hypothetical protein